VPGDGRREEAGARPAAARIARWRGRSAEQSRPHGDGAGDPSRRAAASAASALRPSQTARIGSTGKG